MHEMEEDKYGQMLIAHGIKPTANRIVIARTLSRAARPMSLSELEREILTIDKSNIFRALSVFKNNRMVHVIEEGGEGARYELCLSADHDTDDDQHAHFYCDNCHRTFCMERTPVPAIPLPEGYEMSSVNYVIKGLCPECARKTGHGRGNRTKPPRQ